MKLRDLAKAVILSGSILLSPYLTNKISAGEMPVKKIELYNKIYYVGYDGEKFSFIDETGDYIAPNTPARRSYLIELAMCYLADEKIQSIGVEKLEKDVRNLENLVGISAGSTMLDYGKKVWKDKTKPWELLKGVFKLGDRLETDPKFYITILAGNISAKLGGKQQEAVNLLKGANRFPFDSFIYGRIRGNLEQSEPYVETGYMLLNSALENKNLDLNDEEKDLLSKMKPEKKREYIINKIKESPEYILFESESERRLKDWEDLRKKAAGAAYEANVAKGEKIDEIIKTEEKKIKLNNVLKKDKIDRKTKKIKLEENEEKPKYNLNKIKKYICDELKKEDIDALNYFGGVECSFEILDLNNDKIPEIKAWVPEYCGGGGCNEKIYGIRGEDIFLIIRNFGGMEILNSKTNGYKDIIKGNFDYNYPSKCRENEGITWKAAISTLFKWDGSKYVEDRIIKAESYEEPCKNKR